MRKLTYLLAVAFLAAPLIKMQAQNNPRNLELEWQTNKSKHLVPLDEFTALMQRDGIPPIDQPQFWNREQAMDELFIHEPVIAVEVGGQAKAYPLSILMFHEIVNDVLGDQLIAVTYCPLCNAALVFDRELTHHGEKMLLDFGVSGMLRMSDLVMWDRQTESWWQQFTGEALVGELSGAELEVIPSLLISLEEYFEAYPQGKVLSNQTGHFREYGSNPYTAYDELDKVPRFFKGEIDSRLPPMERLVDIHVRGKYKVYPMRTVSEEEVINDQFEGEPVVLFYTSKTVSALDEGQIADSKQIGAVTVFVPEVNGQTLHFVKSGTYFKDKQTNSVWNIAGQCIEGHFKGSQLRPKAHGNHFAFAWFAFRPESEIYQK